MQFKHSTATQCSSGKAWVGNAWLANAAQFHNIIIPMILCLLYYFMWLEYIRIFNMSLNENYILLASVGSFDHIVY